MISLFKVIAEPSKRQILLELRSGPKSVTELVAATGMKQPNVSNHLAKLRAQDIVKPSKIGRQVYYGLAGPTVEAALAQFVEQADPEAAENVPVADMAKRYARAAVAGDEPTCMSTIDHMIRVGMPLVRIYQDVIAEAMMLIGKWYEVEAIDVGQEHVASAITERMMARVVHYAPPARQTMPTALIGCVAGNWHSIGPRMISDYLRLSGWRPVYLGANVPAGSFVSAIQEHKPRLVLLSCAFSEDRQATCEALDAITKLRGELPFDFVIGLGGNQAKVRPEEFIAAGAAFTSTTLSEFADEILPRFESGDYDSLPPSARAGV